MECVYCGREMEHDSTQGTWYDEVDYYTCLCGAECFVDVVGNTEWDLCAEEEED